MDTRNLGSHCALTGGYEKEGRSLSLPPLESYFLIEVCRCTVMPPFNISFFTDLYEERPTRDYPVTLCVAGMMRWSSELRQGRMSSVVINVIDMKISTCGWYFYSWRKKKRKKKVLLNLFEYLLWSLWVNKSYFLSLFECMWTWICFWMSVCMSALTASPVNS